LIADTVILRADSNILHLILNALCPTINIILLHIVVVKVAIVVVIPGSRAGSAAAADGGDGGIRVMLMSGRGGPGMLPVHVGGLSRLGGTGAWDSERTGCIG